jgi:protein-tyrosine phosphatase
MPSWQARCFNKIQEAQGISRLEVNDDVFHCWQMLDGIVPEAHFALRQAAAFICEHISSSDGATVAAIGLTSGVAAP